MNVSRPTEIKFKLGDFQVMKWQEQITQPSQKNDSRRVWDKNETQKIVSNWLGTLLEGHRGLIS